MAGKFRQLADDFYVAPQLVAEDFAEIKALGVKSVINNRPDHEEPGQLTHAEAQACAQAEGLAYKQVPVISGGIFPDHIAAMREAIESMDGPYLAYCRSGTRSCFLWSFVAAQEMPSQEVIEAAAQAGYDVSSMREYFRQIHAGNQL